MNRPLDLGSARRWAAARIGAHEALILLATASGAAKEAVLVHPGRPLSEEAWARFAAMVDRRALGEPMAYIRGFCAFWRDEFAVGPGVLVPRPESELLVECAARRAPPTLAELGVGSGAVLLSLARELPNARLYGTDISAAALRYAARNARALGIEGVQFYRGDLAAPLARRNIRVAGLLMNPPYVDEGAPGLPRELAFEPPGALFAGGGGLSFYRRLVREAPAVLEPGGTLWVEIGAGMAGEVADIFESGLRFDRLEVFRDLAGIPRVVEARGVWP